MSHEAWGEQSKSWTRALRIRENIDIGWICDEVVQEWSTDAWHAREELHRGIRQFHSAVVDEDAAWWMRHRTRDAAWVGRIEWHRTTGEEFPKCTTEMAPKREEKATVVPVEEHNIGNAVEDIKGSSSVPSQPTKRADGVILPVEGRVSVHDNGIQSAAELITPSQVLNSVRICADTYTDEELGADISYSQIAKIEVENVSGIAKASLSGSIASRSTHDIKGVHCLGAVSIASILGEGG